MRVCCLQFCKKRKDFMKEILGRLNWGTKILLVAGLVLMGWGYVCRLVPVYWFWEARWLGWELVIFGVIGTLSKLIRQKRVSQVVHIGEVVGRVLLVLFIVLQVIVGVSIPRSDAYVLARNKVMNDSALARQVGVIQYCLFVPQGSVNLTTGHGGSFGGATFIFLIKGSRQYVDVDVTLVKRPGGGTWVIDGVNVE
jgi:hypothetical protein